MDAMGTIGAMGAADDAAALDLDMDATALEDIIMISR